MKLSRRRLYDYHDIDPTELKLIRVGHSLWRRLRQLRRQNVVDVGEERALLEAIDIIVDLKAKKRAELAIKRRERSKKLRAIFAKGKL